MEGDLGPVDLRRLAGLVVGDRESERVEAGGVGGHGEVQPVGRREVAGVDHHRRERGGAGRGCGAGRGQVLQERRRRQHGRHGDELGATGAPEAPGARLDGADVAEPVQPPQQRQQPEQGDLHHDELAEAGVEELVPAPDLVEGAERPGDPDDHDGDACPEREAPRRGAPAAGPEGAQAEEEAGEPTDPDAGRDDVDPLLADVQPRPRRPGGGMAFQDVTEHRRERGRREESHPLSPKAPEPGILVISQSAG